MKPDRKKFIIDYLIREWKLTIRQACKLANLNRSSYYYQSKNDINEIQTNISSLIEQGYTKNEILKLLEENEENKPLDKKIKEIISNLN